METELQTKKVLAAYAEKVVVTSLSISVNYKGSKYRNSEA